MELRRLPPEAVAGALEKAERYRFLNEPLEAESICRDVLAVDANHALALVTLVLSLSDQLATRGGRALAEAREALARLPDEYRRHYYGGILCERYAKAHWHRGGPGSGTVAHDWFREALQHFERAIAMRPEGNYDAVLRWNTCTRILAEHSDLKPSHEDAGVTMLE
jgi:tetratricopeptide (TPR) repeat protein